MGAGTATNGTWFATATGLCHGLRQNPPYGVLTETATAPGTANFSAGSNRAFPYVWSKDGLVPTAGDFVLDFRMAYTNVASNGDGIRFRSWADPTPSGTNALINRDTKCSISGARAGSGSGLQVKLGREDRQSRQRERLPLVPARICERQVPALPPGCSDKCMDPRHRAGRDDGPHRPRVARQPRLYVVGTRGLVRFQDRLPPGSAAACD